MANAKVFSVKEFLKIIGFSQDTLPCELLSCFLCLLGDNELAKIKTEVLQEMAPSITAALKAELHKTSRWPSVPVVILALQRK